MSVIMSAIMSVTRVVVGSIDQSHLLFGSGGAFGGGTPSAHGRRLLHDYLLFLLVIIGFDDWL